MKDFNFKRVVTHSTVFHADDVFGVALCKLLASQQDHRDIEIIRTLEPEQYANDETLIFDIGLGEYDHHQPDKALRPIEDGTYTDKDGTEKQIPYCGFGLLWRDFGYILCPEQEAWKRVDKSLVLPIDMHDNGVKQNLLSNCIKNFNPTWNVRASEDANAFETASFYTAVAVATMTLRETIKQANAAVAAVEEIASCYSASPSEQILLLDKYMPYLDAIRDIKYKDVLFVVYPSERGGWNVQTIPKAPGSYKNRMDFPTDWLGHADPDRGIHFAHTANFLIACDTKEQAIKVAEEAIDIGSSEAVCVYSSGD